MSYEPHQWVAGETVTASKLNHMEEGISNNILVISTSLDTSVPLPYTFQQIADVVNNGGMVFIKAPAMIGVTNHYIFAYLSDIDFGEYTLIFYGYNGTLTFKATSANAYPTYYQPEELL